MREKKRICEICGKEAKNICKICGRTVCSEHSTNYGLCIYCARSICELCSIRLAVATCPICGRRICEKCSIQVTPIVRVCKDCFNKYNIKINEWPPLFLVNIESKRINQIATLTLTVLRKKV